MASIWQQLHDQLHQRQSQHLLRRRAVVSSPVGKTAQLDGRQLTVFCSNDYLGLANHPRLIEASQKAAADYGVGSGASHLVCGHSHLHNELEQYFAAMTGRDAALLFSTGYMANLAVISALLGKQDAVFEDRLNHASLLDGGLMSGARFQRFLHNDTGQLQLKLVKSAARRKLVCVDGVFSMDGDIAPLNALAETASTHDALLMVDDAHGFGVLGEHGRGVTDLAGLNQQQVPILMCTLGKAVGSFGALVAGPQVLIDTLIQYARPYIYTTALPPTVAGAALAGLKLIDEESWRRRHLAELVAHFRKEADLLGLPLMASETAIQPLTIGDDQKALQWQNWLAQQGFWVSAIRPPTVPSGTARLRITFSAAHSLDDVDALLEVLAKGRQQADLA